MALPTDLREQIMLLVPTLEGWCPVDRVLEMAACIQDHRPAVCVEIGVFGGRSLLPLAITCRHFNHGHVYGIDSWCQQAALAGLTDDKDREFWGRVDLESIFRNCLTSVLDHGLTQYCTLIRQRSEHCDSLFSAIDLLHIDGNHSPGHALEDVQRFLPRVVPGGHIWFDDADWPSTQEAVRALREQCIEVASDGRAIHFLKPRCNEHVFPLSASNDIINVVAESAPPASGTNRNKQRSGQRRLLIQADDSRLGEFTGGIYNPGAVHHDGRILLLARNERFSELQRSWDGSLRAHSCRPMAVWVTSDLQIETLFPLACSVEAGIDRNEDFRLFRFGDQIYASYSRVVSSDRIEQWISKVCLKGRRLLPPERPQLDFCPMPIEKNWCFFERNHQLWLLYSFQPFRLLRLTDPEKLQFETVVYGSWNSIDDRAVFPVGPLISISAGPVCFGEDWLLFVHYRDEQRIYHHHAVLLDSATLRPRRVSRTPLFSGGDAAGLFPNVLYLMSVLQQQNRLQFFFGEGDSHISVSEMTVDAAASLLAESSELAMSEIRLSEFVGLYEYEHHGLFRRPIFLNSDGTIQHGGEHDCCWRLESAAESFCLQIWGRDQMSCRMQLLSAGHWSGTWNRGARPLATLTRLFSQ